MLVRRSGVSRRRPWTRRRCRVRSRHGDCARARARRFRRGPVAGSIGGIAAGATAAAAAAGYVAYKQIKKPKGGADAGAGADPLLSGGFL